jgi:hypothetical protein
MAIVPVPVGAGPNKLNTRHVANYLHYNFFVLGPWACCWQQQEVAQEACLLVLGEYWVWSWNPGIYRLVLLLVSKLHPWYIYIHREREIGIDLGINRRTDKSGKYELWQIGWFPFSLRKPLHASVTFWLSAPLYEYIVLEIIPVLIPGLHGSSFFFSFDASFHEAQKWISFPHNISNSWT